MKDRGRTWLSVGVFALAGTALTPLPGAAVEGPAAGMLAWPRLPPEAPSARMMLLAQGGEGGEGGASESPVPESYALPNSDPNAYKYDAAAEIAAYASGVGESYRAAAAEGKKLQAAVNAFLADPNDTTLAAVRRAWVTAR